MLLWVHLKISEVTTSILAFITIIILSSIIIHIIRLQQCRNQLLFPDMASVGNYFKKRFVCHYCFDHWLIEFFRQLLSVILDECLFLFSLTLFFLSSSFQKTIYLYNWNLLLCFTIPCIWHSCFHNCKSLYPTCLELLENVCRNSRVYKHYFIILVLASYSHQL